MPCCGSLDLRAICSRLRIHHPVKILKFSITFCSFHVPEAPEQTLWIHADLSHWCLQGGGVLLAAHDRDFGRGRRIQRMNSIPLLWVDTKGCLRAYGMQEEGFACQLRLVADSAWHSVSLVLHHLRAGW